MECLFQSLMTQQVTQSLASRQWGGAYTERENIEKGYAYLIMIK